MTDDPLPAGLFFKGQLLHATLLTILVTAAVLIDKLTNSANSVGELWGWSTRVWFFVSLAVPIAHQLYVWLAWRSELCYGSLTRRFGTAAFTLYRAGFMVLFISRAVVLVCLGCADYGSLGLPFTLSLLIAILFALPAAYTLYSVVRYFGVSRATGIDHFDPAYREMPMVRQGIFRFTGNSMYTFGFMTLWAIAFACSSRAALISAAFSHAYIWVHYLCTERSDMQFLYGAGQGETGSPRVT